MKRKIMVILIIIGLIIITCMIPPVSLSEDGLSGGDEAGSPLDWIVDYRDVDYDRLQIDQEKGLDVYDTKEENSAIAEDEKAELAHMKATSIEVPGESNPSLKACTTSEDKEKGDYYIDLPKNRDQAKNSTITIRYRSVGKYTDEDGSVSEVTCYATYTNFYYYTSSNAPSNQAELIGNEWHPVRLYLYKHYSKGINYKNIVSFDTKYTFYKQNSNRRVIGDPIPLKNTFFSANSLTYNEGISYRTHNKNVAYLNKDYFGLYNQIQNSNRSGVDDTNTIYGELKGSSGDVRFFFGRGIAKNSPYIGDENGIRTPISKYSSNYRWFDDWLGKKDNPDYGVIANAPEKRYAEDYEKGSVSFLLNQKGQSSTEFRFTLYCKFKYDNHVCWFAPSTTKLGTPEIKPVKTVKNVSKGTDYEKSVNANTGDVIEYQITQKLHKIGKNIITGYRNLALEDVLPPEVAEISDISVELKPSGHDDAKRFIRWKSSEEGNEHNNRYGQITLRYSNSTKRYTVKYEASEKFLVGDVAIDFDDTDPDDDDGQRSVSLEPISSNKKLIMKIKCKVNKYINRAVFQNESNTYMNSYVKNGKTYNKFTSKPVDVKILPKLDNKIQKTTSTSVINDAEQIVRYQIKYNVSIQDYIGNATITITDELPYAYVNGTEKLDGGTASNGRKRITWKIPWENVKAPTGSEKNVEVVRNIEFVYAGLPTNSTEPIVNVAYGQTKTEDPAVSSTKVQKECTIRPEYKVTVIGTKLWDDQGKGVDKRPLTYFVLFKNGKATDTVENVKRGTAVEGGKKFQVIKASGLDKYDENGKRINYTIKEVAKQSGDNYYSLSEIKGALVENENDLKYYVETSERQEADKREGGKTITYNITNIYKSFNIRGDVWKDKNKDGKMTSGEELFKGVAVDLIAGFKNGANYTEYNMNNKMRTSESGSYSFNDLPWNGTFKVRFNYNGQIYYPTYFKDNIAGEIYSAGYENPTERSNFNSVFANISESPNNYTKDGEKRRAFGINQLVKKSSDGNIASQTPLFFENFAIKLFDSIDLSRNTYDGAFYADLFGNLTKEIDTDTATQIVNYIKDCIMHADSGYYYFNDPSRLNSGNNNNIQKVNLGLVRREECDLSITNDIAKVTYLLNGKMFGDNDQFNKKSYDIITVENRVNDEWYKHEKQYLKRIPVSDFLFNDDENPNTKLQVFVTYKIVVKNNGQIGASINAIDNYYDTENYMKWNDSKDNKICKDNTDLDEYNIEDTNETINGYTKLKISSNTPAFLFPGNYQEFFITFKVKDENNRVKISDYKKNISEIARYGTYYTTTDEIPDSLGADDKKQNKTITDIIPAGIVDMNSDPGNLKNIDFDEYRNIKYWAFDINGYPYIRLENDTDQSIDYALSIDNGTVRSISGFVFEDNRNVVNNNLKTALGNGTYDVGENRINGVTVQLVELIPELDENNISTGNYIKEKVWGTHKYNSNNELSSKEENQLAYYTGMQSSTVILTGDEGSPFTIVNPTPLGEGETARGKYQFDSIPPGDFYIRFIYGDTDKTVLTNKESEVFSVLGVKGMNEISYNGQDYKSTVYQNGVIQEDLQNYNGISGYTNYGQQNFINNIEDYNNYSKDANVYIKDNIKNKLYIYSNEQNKSNAKDLYGDRERANEYSKTINNYNGEVLQSFEKLASNIGADRKTVQESMLNELKDKTKMRAQTGVMRIAVEHNNNDFNQANLGLVQRPKSQITLAKEVASLRITASNNTIVFDTNRSVNNLYFGKHMGHNPQYDGLRLVRVDMNSKDGDIAPELIQAYVDDELMKAGRMIINYKIVAQNVGEVDYTDSKFYYTGNEDDLNNVSKTRVNKIVDYIQNTEMFEPRIQQESDSWSAKTADELIKNNMVTGKYRSIMETYNNILVSEGLNKDLTPEKYGNNDKVAVSLVMLTGLSNVLVRDAYVYNNLAEIIQISNDQGRRCAFSIPGNEEMQDQTLVNNAMPGASVLDRKTPEEIDADSAQKITIMPPTGEENYTWIVVILAVYVGIIICGALIIKKLIAK